MRLISSALNRLRAPKFHAGMQTGNVRIGSSKLGNSFRVRFDIPHDYLSVTVGDGCFLNSEIAFESSQGRVTIGNDVFINSGTRLISRSAIEIGNSVMIAWGCTLYDHDSHSIDYRDRLLDHKRFTENVGGNPFLSKDWSHVRTAPITICDYVWLGFEVVVLKGITIGEGSIVGARSVVGSDVPPWTIVAGNPARPIKEVPRELRRS